MEKKKTGMQTKTKVILILIAIVIAVIGLSILGYHLPKKFLRGVHADEVEAIYVFDRSNGESFEIKDSDDIKHIVKNIKGISFKRDGISILHMGTTFSMTFYDEDGDVIDSFFINSDDTIRRDPFFYVDAEKSICFDYIADLEKQLCD